MYMYILLFEKNQMNVTTSGSKGHSSSISTILSHAHHQNIIPDTKQVKDNYSSILQFCSISVPTTCKDMRAQILQNEENILTSLKRMCMEQSSHGAVKRKNDNQQSDSSPPKITKRVQKQNVLLMADLNSTTVSHATGLQQANDKNFFPVNQPFNPLTIIIIVVNIIKKACSNQRQSCYML